MAVIESNRSIVYIIYIIVVLSIYTCFPATCERFLTLRLIMINVH